MSNERLTGWKKQELAFNYAKEREFGSGLRRAALYADLGVAEATGGQFRAHVIKVNHDRHTDKGTTGMHRHDYDFQFNYVISGSITFVIEGAGPNFVGCKNEFVIHRILAVCESSGMSASWGKLEERIFAFRGGVLGGSRRVGARRGRTGALARWCADAPQGMGSAQAHRLAGSRSARTASWGRLA